MYVKYILSQEGIELLACNYSKSIYMDQLSLAWSDLFTLYIYLDGGKRKFIIYLILFPIQMSKEKGLAMRDYRTNSCMDI